MRSDSLPKQMSGAARPGDGSGPAGDGVTVERTADVVYVTLNRPPQRNALTVPMMRAIAGAIEAAGRDGSTRAIVIGGAGDRSFCAGADLTPSGTPFVADFEATRLPFADLLRSAHSSEVPIVCAINGACVAGGMGFLGVCDIAIASRTALFGMPEVKVGLFPMQILAVLRDLIPTRMMADMCLTGRLVTADEALAAGLVNRVVEPDALSASVEAWLDELRQASPVAVRRGKYAMRAMADMSFEQMIAFAETQVSLMSMTEDAREGMKAFLEKRVPAWAAS